MRAIFNFLNYFLWQARSSRARGEASGQCLGPSTQSNHGRSPHCQRQNRNWLRDLELFGNYSWSHAIDTLSEGTTYYPRPKTPSSNEIIFQAGFLPSTGTSLRNSALTTLGSTSRFPSSWILIFKVWHLGRREPGTELQNLDVWGNPRDCPLLTCWPHF